MTLLRLERMEIHPDRGSDFAQAVDEHCEQLRASALWAEATSSGVYWTIISEWRTRPDHDAWFDRSDFARRVAPLLIEDPIVRTFAPAE